MTKRKKNTREKRALVGALCTAAVIVAGSTFVWFTSSDEVTNRLTASADYGVSIVESFTPPENWIPGSEIKKDVYATNTGNIGAYVRERISGALAITVEQPTSDFDANKCIKLTDEERYVMEAGAFLAYKPADDITNHLGNQIIIRDDDQETPFKTDFTPSATGLYVFRRSIVVDGTGAETFEYSGYYYNNGSYYKISDLSVTPDLTVDKANDGIKTDGNLSFASAGYYVEDSKVINPIDLELDATNNRLIATYDTGVTGANDVLEAAAKRLDAANHNLQLGTVQK